MKEKVSEKINVFKNNSKLKYCVFPEYIMCAWLLNDVNRIDCWRSCFDFLSKRS